MPAVLLEVGYISHPDEAVRIADEKYQEDGGWLRGWSRGSAAISA
jgi:hypothetical protein